MELGLTLRAAATGASADVVIRAPDGAALRDVADHLLATVLPAGTTGRLSVNGTAIADGTLLGAPPLVAGSLLEVDAPVRPAPLTGLPEAHVVGGPAAGSIHPLAPGASVVVDSVRLTLAASGAAVEDPATGTTTGLPYGEVLRVGDTVLSVVRPSEAPAPVVPTGGGHLAFNRPPRLVPPRDVVQVVVPAPPAERERNPLPLLAILAPLVLGVVMWRVLGNATFLLFTLLSPVMVIGNVVTERRNGRRLNRKSRALWQAQRDVAERTLAEAVRTDELHRRSAHPDPALLFRTALGPRPRLWERRRADEDLLDLRLGVADQPANVEAEGDVTAEMTTARCVPVVVRLRELGVLGIAGPRTTTQGMARWLVTQAVTLHSPRDLQLVVVAEPAAAPAWEWVVRLPHCVPDGGQDCGATVGLGTAQAAARIAELAALVEARRSEQHSAAAARTDERPVLLVVDGARALRALPGLATLLTDGPDVNVFTLALEQDARMLPEECSAAAIADGPRLDVRRRGLPDLTGALLDGVPPSYAEAVARALAPLHDGSRDRADGLPSAVRWTEVAELPLAGTADDVAAVLHRWAASGRTTSALLGQGPDGRFAVDLARHGPHALVAGTTGAGKSELLQTMLASLAAGNRPDELNLLLVDFKGGAAFGSIARLPHTVGMVTDLDGSLVERALASLTAELRRREALLADVGAKDLDDYRRSAAEPLPRLVIVVDEFAALADELPEFVGGLVGIAQRGRSLGVHLVLATQRPEGVVSADIRANTNLRICLAVAREAESRDVIDSPAAATVSRTTPGRGYARTGHTELTPFQTARVGGRRPSVVTADERPSVRIVPATELGEAVSRTSGEDREDVTDLSLLVDACCAAADRLGIPASVSPWLPPLPEVLTLDELPPGDGIAFGLVDVPESQTRRPLLLDLDRSTHLMVVGSPRSGRTTALRTLAGSLGRSTSPDDVHLYGIDLGGGGLAPLASLPHTGAVAGRENPERIERVLTWLSAEVTRRSAALSEAGHAGLAEQRAAAAPADRLPHLVLLLDRWEGFVATYQDLDAGRLIDLVYRLLREGPAAGLHVVLTADRSGLAGRISSMVEDRLVLRLADRGDYAGAGLASRLVPDDLPAGRGWSVSGAPLVAQVALLDPDPSGPAQTAALERLAGSRATRTPPHRIEPLPSRVDLSELASSSGVVLGIGGDELQARTLDESLLIAGPPGSGRSTALLALGRQLLAQGKSVVAVAPRPSPLRQLPGCHTDRDASYDLEALLGLQPDALLIDDAELLVDSPLAYVLETAVRDRRDTGLLVVAAGSTEDLVTGYRGFVVELRRARTGVLLSPQAASDGDLLGVRLSRGTGGDVHPGRGLLCRRGAVEPLQLALTA